MLKLKLQYFSYLMPRADLFKQTNKQTNLDAGNDWGQEKKGVTEDDG